MSHPKDLHCKRVLRCWNWWNCARWVNLVEFTSVPFSTLFSLEYCSNLKMASLMKARRPWAMGLDFYWCAWGHSWSSWACPCCSVPTTAPETSNWMALLRSCGSHCGLHLLVLGVVRTVEKMKKRLYTIHIFFDPNFLSLVYLMGVFHCQKKICFLA